MNYDIRVINPIKNIKWDDDLVNEDDFSVFYSSQWITTLINTYNYKPLYFVLYKNDKISAYIHFMEINSYITGKRGVSLPFSDICEPFAESTEDFNILFNYIKNYAKKEKWKQIELRGGEKFLKTEKPLTEYYEHILDINKPVEDIYSGFKENVKRNIKKAQHFDIKIEREQSKKAMENFIYLNKITRKRHGLPSQPDKFFYNLYDEVISKDLGNIFSASYKNKTIASIVVLTCSNNVLYKYGASDLDFQEMRANNLVMWESIKYYSEKKCKNFSFGRTFPENKGLMQFKNGWTEKVQKVCYYKYNLKKDSFLEDNDPEKSFTNRIFEKMPIFMLSCIGTFLYKHFG
jgi:hypothetical protein